MKLALLNFTAKLKVIFIITLFCLSLKAQLPGNYNFNTAGLANSFPLNITGGKCVQWLYLPGEFNQPAVMPAGNISMLAFRLNENYSFGPYTYTNFTIKLGQSTITTMTAGNFYTGPMDTVYFSPSVTFTGTPGQWLNISLDTVFNYNPNLSLIVEISQCGSNASGGYSTCQTDMSNVRRIYSIGGCPFTASGGDARVAHIGFNICSFPNPPTNTTYSNNLTICSGNTTTLSATGTGTLGWYTNSVGGTYLGSSSNLITNPLLANSTVYVQDSTACGSSTRTAISVNVNPSPTINVNSGAICFGKTFTISPSGATTYTIQGGNFIVTPATTTSYTITGTNTLGCTSNTPAISNVSVNPLPLVQVQTSHSVLCIGQTVTLTANGASTYTWNTASSNTSIVVSPTATTVYTVTGEDANGCQNTALVSQNVSACNGINESIDKTSFVQIYPNPASNVLNIKLSGFDLNSTSIKITNILGQDVINASVNMDQFELNLTNMPNGLYFVRVLVNNKEVVNHKLIKQ